MLKKTILSALFLTILTLPSFAASSLEKTAEFKTLLSDASQGNEEHQLKLGFIYANGDGVEQNYTKAVK
ncbi:MAG: hypothetical protein OQK59_00715, partial [Chlorobium sp.]|nr:hypothetical protein [Chlorobium sp.]